MNMIEIQKFEYNKKVSYRRLGKGSRRILFFHGFPGSSLQVSMFENHIDRHNLDVICLDRPGYNQTELHNDDQLLESVDDANHLLKSLGWEKFEVFSVSGGTPFLFSFVKKCPDKVIHINVVCGLGPLSDQNFSKETNLKTKVLLQVLCVLPNWVFGLFRSDSVKLKVQIQKILNILLPKSESDGKVMQNENVSPILFRSFQEAIMQNGNGIKRDAKAYLSAWNVDLPKFNGTISIWHGQEDKVILQDVAQKMASLLPNSKLHIFQNEGHYSIAYNQVNHILENRDTL